MKLSTFVRTALGAFALFVAALCLSFVPTIVHAQAVSGTITGVVTDTSGAVIAGASVFATDTATGVVHSTPSALATRSKCRGAKAANVHRTLYLLSGYSCIFRFALAKSSFFV